MMKLKTKIHLYTSIWLLILLMLVHTAVYLIFSSALTSKDAARLADETDNIAEALHTAETQGVALQDMLQAYLPANGMVRIVNADQKAVMTITKEKAYKDFPLTFHSGETTDVTKHKGKLFAAAAVPVIWTDGQVVSLQLVERLEHTEESLFLLKFILIAASAAVCIASFFAGSLLARHIINPIRQLVTTMKDIQREKAFKTISLKGQSHDELYQMGLTFNEMASMLKEHYDKQQQFVQDASHELKTPLTIIESYSNLMKRWGAKRPEVLEESIEAIHSEAIHMKKLTNQLLTLAKSHKEMELDLKTVDLIEMSRAVIQTLQPVYKRDIFLETGKEHLPVTADEERIKQLLTILLDNAIKYSDKGIVIAAGTKNSRPFLSVWDEGIGIPEEHLPRLFERFYRADEARNRKTGGTGLGLSIAKHIADEHGIDLSVKSKPGQGTNVTMQFREQNGGAL
jgi:signal transduction histidine kinase